MPTASTPATPTTNSRPAPIRAAALGLVLALVAEPALAAGSRADKAEARRQFQVGVAAAEAGAYAEAIVEFDRAYELSPNFAVLYNIATAEEALGDEPAALTAFERYLAEGGQAVPAARRAELAAEMKQLTARTGVVVPRVTPDGARLTLDGVALEPAAIGHGVRVKVGAHTLAASKERYVPAEQTITVASGDSVDVKLSLEPVPEAPQPRAPPPPPLPPAPAPAAAPPQQPLLIQLAPPPAPAGHSSGGALRAFGYAVGGVGLAALVTGGALYLDSWLQGQNAINNGCTQNLDTCKSNGRTEWENSLSYAKASQIVAAVGGALLIGGVVMLAVAPSGSGAPASVALVGRF
jgi:tetratricopeptide (TPR) repeat protein